MSKWLANAQIVRPCQVLIEAGSEEEAITLLRLGRYDEVINEQGGAMCEDVQVFPDTLSLWEDEAQP